MIWDFVNLPMFPHRDGKENERGQAGGDTWRDSKGDAQETREETRAQDAAEGRITAQWPIN